MSGAKYAKRSNVIYNGSLEGVPALRGYFPGVAFSLEITNFIGQKSNFLDLFGNILPSVFFSLSKTPINSMFMD